MTKVLDRSLGAFFWEGVRISARRPSQAMQFARMVRRQAVAARLRGEWAKRGIQVPPVIIFSVTHRCNLQCAGCYARSFHDSSERPPTGDPGSWSPSRGPETVNAEDELSSAMLDSIVAQADVLGVSFFVVAGGEPLMRPEILDIAGRFPHILFLLLTNGTLLDPDTIMCLARLRNVIPLVSLEGSAKETDERRGRGTHRQLMGAMKRLEHKRLFFGCSITLTARNFSVVLDDDYVGGLMKAGCRCFLLLDYTPTDEDTRDWALTTDQRAQVAARIDALKRSHRALFIAVPWDELAVGGCLAAGRGFVHINASGDLEPCPFAPYSDFNLRDGPLVEALRSPFLAGLRAEPELLRYSGGGCSLWKNREQVERVLADVANHLAPISVCSAGARRIGNENREDTHGEGSHRLRQLLWQRDAGG